MKEKVVISDDNLSITRINEMCLDCGLCKITCKKTNNLSDDGCINCGQCIMTCPSGALKPKYDYKKVLNYIKDTDKIVIANIAPSVRVAIGDEFGYEPGEFIEKQLVACLKEIGFDYVFDIAFGADVTVIEEAKELYERLKDRKNLPQFSSCCPSWVKYVNNYQKDFIDNLSKCKSPIGIQGAIIKSYFAELNDIPKENIINVTFAPCVSKKSEIKKDGNHDTDYILTTTELIMMIKELTIDIHSIKEKEFDNLLGKSSKNGLAFGVSGGVLNAVVRTLYYMLNKENAPLDLIKFKKINNIEIATVDLNKTTIKVGKVYGIKNFDLIKEQIKQLDFVEYMTCDNGCINGGGQTLIPRNKFDEYNEKRFNSLLNNNHSICDSYENPDIKEFYNTYLTEERIKDLLHY